MLKARYYALRLNDTARAAKFRGWADRATGRSIMVVDRTDGNVVLRYRTVRQIPTTQLDENGDEVRGTATTIESYSARIFRQGDRHFFCLLDPPRSTRVVEEMLSLVFGDSEYFYEGLDLSAPIIKRHVDTFDTAKLVSARVRDFRVFHNAVGRLEISSKDGLPPEIAPFLKDGFYRVDSLTYEVISGFTRGQITYSSGGTVRASQPIVDVAFPTFEACL